jgi:hypothetical protein
VTEGSKIHSYYGGERDTAYNESVSNAFLDAIGQGRQEHSMLWGQGMELGKQTLAQKLAEIGLNNQTQQMMEQANLLARGQEWQERFGEGQLATQNAAIGAGEAASRREYDLQRALMALQAQGTLFGQQMSERGTLYNELAQLVGLGAPAGMEGYWQPGSVSTSDASNSAMQNAMYKFQSNPLVMLITGILGMGTSYFAGGYNK